MASCTGCGDGCGYSDCKGTCQGCSGWCDDGCSGCGITCSGGCSGGCSGDCEGGCSGACLTGCLNACKTFCNTACSTSNSAAVIANLGNTVYKDGRWYAPDIVSIKNAIINEFRRRGNASYQNNYSVEPVSQGKLLAEHYKKILEDVYAIDSSKDWRGNVTVGKKVAAADMRPAIDYIKQLMNTIVAKP